MRSFQSLSICKCNVKLFDVGVDSSIPITQAIFRLLVLLNRDLNFEFAYAAVASMLVRTGNNDDNTNYYYYYYYYELTRRTRILRDVLRFVCRKFSA